MARAVPATQQQLGVATSRIGEDVRKFAAAVKTLEGRLDTYSALLAALQQRKTGEQSGGLIFPQIFGRGEKTVYCKKGKVRNGRTGKETAPEV